MCELIVELWTQVSVDELRIILKIKSRFDECLNKFLWSSKGWTDCILIEENTLGLMKAIAV
jgi:hypothetical protein